jgi:hypothetical protein
MTRRQSPHAKQQQRVSLGSTCQTRAPPCLLIPVGAFGGNASPLSMRTTTHRLPPHTSSLSR